MRKTLLITLEFPPQKGGTQSYYFNICKNLPSDKIVILAPKISQRCPSHKGVSDTSAAINFKIYRKNLLIKYLYPHWVSQVWHLYKIIKKEKIELIQVGQVLPCGTAVYIINKFLKIPYIVYTHGLDILGPQKNSSAGWWKKKLIIKILSNAEKIISNSEFTKGEVEKLGIYRDKIIVVYPSVKISSAGVSLQRTPARLNQDYLTPTPQSPRGDCGGAFNSNVKQTILVLNKKYNLDNKKILLTVCRLVDRKGVDLVISALEKFGDQLKNLVYVIIGDGPEMENLRNLAKNLPQIIFAGKVGNDELSAWYQMCDIFILTPKKSKFDVEGFGIVFLEAGSYGKAVIGSNVGGVVEAVQDNATGILVEPNNVEEIGDAIVKLFNDDLKEKLGRQGKERALKEFNIKKQIERLKEIL